MPPTLQPVLGADPRTQSFAYLAHPQTITSSILTLRFSPDQGNLILTDSQITMSDDFMRRAIALALDNVRSARGGPFGAVITSGGHIISEGVNSVTSHNDPTAHAETNAIRAACRALGSFDLAGCDLYTTCEPCPMCLGAIYWSHLDRIFYAGTAAEAADAGFDDAFIYEQLKRPPDSRRIPMRQILYDESLAIFSAWKQQSNKVSY
jgi:guanine deaminase